MSAGGIPIDHFVLLIVALNRNMIYFFQQVAESGFALFECPLRAPLLGDILDCSDGGNGRSVCVVCRLILLYKGLDASAFQHNPVFDVSVRLRVFILTHKCVPVIGQGHVQKFLEGRRELIRIFVENSIYFVGPEELSGCQVQFPAACFCYFLGFLQVGLTLFEGLPSAFLFEMS